MSQTITSFEAEPVSTGIHDYRITDLKSLEEVTKGPRQIAGSYFFQMMEGLVDIAYKVSALANRRPQMKGLETGFLILLVCTALYVEIDPRICNGICQLLARFMIGTN